MKLGITLYNFHSIIDTFEDLDLVLTKLSEMGVGVVQVSGIGKLDNYKVAEYCKKHNMEVKMRIIKSVKFSFYAFMLNAILWHVQGLLLKLNH